MGKKKSLALLLSLIKSVTKVITEFIRVQVSSGICLPVIHSDDHNSSARVSVAQDRTCPTFFFFFSWSEFLVLLVPCLRVCLGWTPRVTQQCGLSKETDDESGKECESTLPFGCCCSYTLICSGNYASWQRLHCSLFVFALKSGEGVLAKQVVCALCHHHRAGNVHLRRRRHRRRNFFGTQQRTLWDTDLSWESWYASSVRSSLHLWNDSLCVCLSLFKAIYALFGHSSFFLLSFSGCENVSFCFTVTVKMLSLTE